MSSLAKKHHATSAAVVRAMSLFSGVKVVTILASLVRNKLIAVFAGPAGLGLVILYNSIIDIIGTASRLSVDQSAQRDISGGSACTVPATVTVVRRWGRWLALAGALVMVAISPLLSFLSFGDIGHWPTFCLLAIVPAAVTMANIDIAVNQGLRRFRAVASGTVTGSILGLVVAVPLVIFMGIRSIEWIVLTYGISTWIGATAFRARVARVPMPAREVMTRGRSFVRLGILITVSTLITQALAYVFVLYLNDSASTAVLGRYQGGYTLVNTYVGVVLAGIWMEYYPRLSALAHSPRRTEIAVNHEILLVLKVLTPVLIIFVLAARWIVWLVYAADFEPVVPYIVIAAVGVVLRAVSWCLGFVVLAAGDGRAYLATESASAVIGLTLNILGYHLGGFFGLGISYIIWYGIYTIIIARVVARRGILLRRPTYLAALAAFTLTALAATLALL